MMGKIHHTLCCRALGSFCDRCVLLVGWEGYT